MGCGMYSLLLVCMRVCSDGVKLVNFFSSWVCMCLGLNRLKCCLV